MTEHMNMLMESMNMDIGNIESVNTLDLMEDIENLEFILQEMVDVDIIEGETLNEGALGAAIMAPFIAATAGAGIMLGKSIEQKQQRVRRINALKNAGKWSAAGISVAAIGLALYRVLRKNGGKDKVQAAQLAKRELLKAKAGAGNSKNPEKARAQADKGIARLDKIIATAKQR